VPELPEVQALVTDLGRLLTGRVIERLDLASFSALKTFDPPATALNGCEITSVTRHGKFLDIVAGQDLHIVIHLARAGWIRKLAPGPLTPVKPSSRSPLAARLRLVPVDDETSGLDITEAGTKKSLAIWVVRDPARIEGVARLGPDPLDPEFTVDVLAGILAKQGRAQIKGVLRYQSNIAGIGNAYSDEILHAAKMSPFKPSAMTPEEVQRLYDAMQETLRAAVARADGLAASELKHEKKTNLQVHGRNGEPCPVCGDTVRQVRFADSSLEYCPTCQTGGKPLADRVLSRLLK
jgi:formamidopyrimidine-DNA glycosylase